MRHAGGDTSRPRRPQATNAKHSEKLSGKVKGELSVFPSGEHAAIEGSIGNRVGQTCAEHKSRRLIIAQPNAELGHSAAVLMRP
jgi:hypothetical protein